MPLKSSRNFLISMLSWSLLLGTGLAIGMRHDVQEKEYLDLAKNAGQYEVGQYPDFSAVAAIGIPEGGSSFEVVGSGTLVAPQWVLTAAHVVLSKKKRKGDFENRIRVRFGTDTAIGFKEYTVTGIATPLPVNSLRALKSSGWRYSEKRIVEAEFNDVALMKLDRPVEGITPIPWQKTETSLLNRTVYIAGFGDAAKGNNPKEKTWARARFKRAAENNVDRDLTINPLTGKRDGGLLLFDFDNGEEERNSLNGDNCRTWEKLFGRGTSDAKPLPLEGAPYPGDSGGPALAKIDGVWQIVGVGGYGTGYPPDKRRSSIEYGDILVYTRVASQAYWLSAMLAPPTAEEEGPSPVSESLPVEEPEKPEPPRSGPIFR